MLCPDFNEFKKYSKKGNLIPVYREILADLETPLSAFLKLKEKNCFLLESVEGGEKWGRYSFIGSNPSMIIEGSGKDLTIKKGRKKTKVTARKDPLEIISAQLKQYKPVSIPGLPRFFGGFVGYIGYDTVRYFEELPDNGHEGLNLPDIFLMLTDTLVVFDNLTHKIKVISNAHIEGSVKDAYEKAELKINRIIRKLRSKAVTPESLESKSSGRSKRGNSFSSNFTKSKFMKAVEKTKKYVRAGDVIQTVISQNFEKDTDVPPINVYRALRVINPSPYMYYMEAGESTIVGTSPEVLVRVEDRTLELRPIAGTRRRGKTPEDDIFMEEELKADHRGKIFACYASCVKRCWKTKEKLRFIRCPACFIPCRHSIGRSKNKGHGNHRGA
jgi:anthranilate synthase component 1